MSKSSIKWKLPWPFIFISIGMFFGLIIEKTAFGTYFIALACGLAFIVLGILFTLRYKIYQPMLVACWTGLAIWHYFLAARPEVIVDMMNMIGIHTADSSTVTWLSTYFKLVWSLVHIGTLMIISPLFSPPIFKSVKLEKSARRIFKLAADMVTDTTNGFTERPYYAGKEEFSKDEIVGFARYLSGKEITASLFSNDSVRIGFSMGRSPLSDKSFQKISHIDFANDGKVMVRISEQDYKMYRKQLTFDQLCNALSNVFRRFLTYYRDGNEERIVTELKSV
jgi:hypothetical protein